MTTPAKNIKLNQAATWLSQQSYLDPYWATQALIRYELPTTMEYVRKIQGMVRPQHQAKGSDRTEVNLG